MESLLDTHVHTLVTALNLSESRGASALVVGASARARVALMSRVADEYRREHPDRLVVTVGVAEARASRFAAIETAIDEALAARRAPASLGEEGSVASWLYRARASGAAGLLLVVHDVDALVDARGGQPGIATFRALVDAVSRGPWSVLAGVRASSAAGAPAVSRELSDSFGAVVTLGGPSSVVTRDPSSLAATLAGRSFHPSGLRAAVTAWLALPPPRDGLDEDDTTVVFSSPLAPPLLTVDPGVTVAWDRARAHVGAAPEAPRVEREVNPAESARWSQGLRSAVRASSAARSLRAAPLATVADIERAFTRWVAPMGADMLAASALGATTGVELDALRRVCDAARARFAEGFEAVLPAVEAAPATVLRGADLAAKLAAHAAVLDARSTAFVSLPGLRADQWGTLRDKVLASVPGLERVSEGTVWSLPEERERFEGDLSEVTRTHRGSEEVLRVGAYTAATDEAAAAAIASALPSLCVAFAGPAAVVFASEWGARAGDVGERDAMAVLVPWGLYTYAARTS